MTTSTPLQIQMDQLSINTIRTLSMDAVQAANSGHPGTPMALAPLVYTLWNRTMRFDPMDPIWPGRDRFVLSNGHASMLLWSVLHLTGTRAVNADYERLGDPSVTLDDIRHFRQLGSKAPGHPGVPDGVGRGNDHRPARPGHRHQRRHGDRGALARRSLQPSGLRAVRLPHLRGMRRRLPDGRGQQRGGVARRPPRAGSSLLDLRQQSHHHRRQHGPGVHRGRRGPVPGLRVERAARRRRQRHRSDRARLRGLSEDQGPAHDHHPRQQHRLRLAQPPGHRGRPRRAARPRRDPPHQARLRLAGGRDLPRARRRARTLRRRRREARRGRAPCMGGALRRLPRPVPGPGRGDRSDAAARAAGRLGSESPGVPRRSEGRGRTRGLGQSAERARAERPVAPGRLGRPGAVEQDHADLQRAPAISRRRAPAAGTCTSASASTRWDRS